ncbi:MAG: DUF6586 family protein [Pseudomonadota bacterium]|nr:DUF6586 family protein [Pseudomonadota bacterium]MEC9409013.1 DUF6586 family protein [Pseudomonadota bacterium]
MSQWLSFTNQKLYQARLLLEQSRRETGNPALAEGLETSGLYLMQDAFISYLNELATLATYRGEVSSFSDLLNKTPLVTGEMTEIRILAEDPYSWLSAFLREAETRWRPGPAGNPQAAGAVNVIAVAQSDDIQPQSWWQHLSELIDSQRENRQES